MNEIIAFLQQLFDTSDWPPRWVCGKWSDFHGWLYVGSDVAIWLAYFIIPVVIIWFVQKRPKVPFLPVFWLFAAFIILCGATHILDAIIFWWPAYRLSALVRFLTAIISFATVFALIRDLPKLLDAKAPNSVDDFENSRLRLELEEKDAEISQLKKQLKI
ncbi:hypothetical protein SAMN04488009_1089 [Maribacter sedimenticola]|uniref:Ethylene receptor 1-like N-terminal domain-containing protein n=1 Tax=Maribacter sedimenticola TaxID=228956 RepID=A0ABY1SE68_9FLAO|nr:hypothetical protein [Maribacter sedimenticola]SNR30589.1 hypothetical protein SAMN04488009_1089 [Maribacter sedimenticola]